MKYEVQVNGHADIYRSFSATVDVEAESEEEALEKAEEKASGDSFDWGEGEDQTMDLSVNFTRAEVTGEFEEL